MVIELRHRDWSVVGIHGAKTRDERQKALDAFKSGSSSILVLDRRCSSAAGRRPCALRRPLRPTGERGRLREPGASSSDGSGMAYAFLAPDDARHPKEPVSHLLDSGEKVILGFSK
ncbi:hypothetical protein HPB52_020587 [Rhipicephalus sanguineus]|uniref:Uncharacterized protein n=1 Tax=Rhipicephalus sanguineus TaxID=34632 RepID=A0A9D4PD68_RHISA|nr:hypothetical protein HPB52_020587 [Rhipicephalus sanguineus]